MVPMVPWYDHSGWSFGEINHQARARQIGRYWTLESCCWSHNGMVQLNEALFARAHLRWWLPCALFTGGCFILAVALVAYREVAWAYSVPASADTQTPALRLLLLMGVVAALIGLIQGVRSPLLGLAAPLVTGVAASIAAAAATALQGLRQPCPGPGDCDIAAAPASVEVLVAAVTTLTLCAVVGWVIGWSATTGLRMLRRG